MAPHYIIRREKRKSISQGQPRSFVACPRRAVPLQRALSRVMRKPQGSCFPLEKSLHFDDAEIGVIGGSSLRRRHFSSTILPKNLPKNGGIP